MDERAWRRGAAVGWVLGWKCAPGPVSRKMRMLRGLMLCCVADCEDGWRRGGGDAPFCALSAFLVRNSSACSHTAGADTSPMSSKGKPHLIPVRPLTLLEHTSHLNVNTLITRFQLLSKLMKATLFKMTGECWLFCPAYMWLKIIHYKDKMWSFNYAELDW